MFAVKYSLNFLLIHSYISIPTLRNIDCLANYPNKQPQRRKVYSLQCKYSTRSIYKKITDKIALL